MREGVEGKGKKTRGKESRERVRKHEGRRHGEETMVRRQWKRLNQ